MILRSPAANLSSSVEPGVLVFGCEAVTDCALALVAPKAQQRLWGGDYGAVGPEQALNNTAHVPKTVTRWGARLKPEGEDVVELGGSG